MRDAFFHALTELAEEDPRVYLIVGDLGFGCIDQFASRFPGRFINAGVAEQNMTGLATGLALAGNVVFTYSIANFPTLRCLEQIRNDACYHQANVKIVAVGGGMAYGSLGMSHYATEDLAILRALPDLAVVAPGDPVETAAATRAVARHPGACYLRIGRAGEATVHDGTPPFQIGKAIRVRDGDDLTLISTGGMLRNAVSAADRLRESGVRAAVLSMHTLKPLDAQAVLDAAVRTRCVVTVEEHSVCGGLGGAVAEVLCESGIPGVRFRRLGLPATHCTEVGSHEYLLHKHGLSADGLDSAVRSVLAADVSAPGAHAAEPTHRLRNQTIVEAAESIVHDTSHSRTSQTPCPLCGAGQALPDDQEGAGQRLPRGDVQGRPDRSRAA